MSSQEKEDEVANINSDAKDDKKTIEVIEINDSTDSDITTKEEVKNKLIPLNEVIKDNKTKLKRNTSSIKSKKKIKVESKDSSFQSSDNSDLVDKCPICNLHFNQIMNLEFRQSHINNCIDKPNSSFISLIKSPYFNKTSGATIGPTIKREFKSKVESRVSKVGPVIKTERSMVLSNEMYEDLDKKGYIELKKENEVMTIEVDEIKCEDVKTEDVHHKATLGCSITDFHKRIKLTNDLYDANLLINRGSLVYNPNDPIVINTPDLYHNAKSKIKRPLPDAKKVPDTTFSVDAFNIGAIPLCKAYFLTHFHSDHYGGIGKTFSHAKIFCSKITASLLNIKIGVNMDYIHPLEMNTLYIIDNVKVILIDANHCPGSALFLFEVPNSDNLDHSDPNKIIRILHTGDFRVHKDIHLHTNSLLTKLPLDYLYLDTTYCNPSYAFPSQRQVIDKAIVLTKEFINSSPVKDNFKNTLHNFGMFIKSKITHKPIIKVDKVIVVGSYSIGKERIFLSIAKTLNSKVCIKPDKLKLLNALDDINLINILTLDPTEAKVHVLPMNMINAKSLKEYYKELKKTNPNLKSIMGIKPTGWTFSNRFAPANNDVPSIDLDDLKPSSKCDIVTVYGLPYSEHSSFEELKSIVEHTNLIAKQNNKQLKIVPTVKPANVGFPLLYQILNEWQK